MMNVYGPKFYFDCFPVGLFLEAEGPTAPGCQRYEPFRGAGHLEMHRRLRAGGSPQCYYEATGELVAFTVRGCPKYGLLKLCDF